MTRTEAEVPVAGPAEAEQGARVIQIRVSEREFQRFDALSKKGIMPRSQVVRLAALAGLDFVEGRIATPIAPPPPPAPVIDATAIKLREEDCHLLLSATHVPAYNDALTTMHNVALGLGSLMSRRYDLPARDAYYTMAVALRDLFLSIAIIGDNMQRSSFDNFVAKLVQAAEDRWVQAHKEAVCTTPETIDKAGLS